MNEAAISRIHEIENVWVPMSDGCRIAARIWMPSNAETAPVPAVLEYIPYRKRDFMRDRDEPIHRYFAMNGYAAVRVDLRGSGDSEGVLHDEYAPQEHADALEIIDWISRQPWCAGTVGMMGISWGGFNALQVAALRPPALKAIIALCASDDRYADDAHYMGGCLLNENMQWGSVLTLYSALPPDPAIVGEAWRDIWRQRLEAVEPFPALWMGHQWRDDYWKHGSVCEDFAAITCPVYAMGGWADAYSNAVPRLMANLTCPRKGLIGPWAHNFPHDGVPGPAIGFLQEAVRWWDTWLKNQDTGIMAEPAYRVWLQESVPPQPQYESWPGRWVAEDSWPSPRIKPELLHLNPGYLGETADHVTELTFCSPQTTGLRGGEWCAFGVDGEMPSDQRPEDGGSLCFDTEPLDARLEIMGAPVIELELRADKPVALIAARLCDIAPDGSSLRVSYGLLNLAHRTGHEFPEPMVPGAWTRVRLQLNDVACAFPAGHRIRLALSTSYWPIAWPAPEIAIIGVRTGNSTLELPVRPVRDEDSTLRGFEVPKRAPGLTPRKLRRLPMRRLLQTDLATNEYLYTLHSDAGEFGGASLVRLEEIDLELGTTMRKRYRIIETDPLSAQCEFTHIAVMRRDDWAVRIECRMRMTGTADAFQFAGEVVVYEGDVEFAHREWNTAIPRALV